MKIESLDWLDAAAGGGAGGGERAARPVGADARDGCASAAAAPGEAGDRRRAARSARKRLRGRGGAERGRARVVRSADAGRIRLAAADAARFRSAAANRFRAAIAARTTTRFSGRARGVSGSRGAASAGWRAAAFLRRLGAISGLPARISDRDRYRRAARARVAAGPPGCADRAGVAAGPGVERTRARMEPRGGAGGTGSRAALRSAGDRGNTRGPRRPVLETEELLAEKALEADIGRFVDRDELEQLRARAAFAGIAIDERRVLAELCRGSRALREHHADLPTRCGRRGSINWRRSGCG